MYTDVLIVGAGPTGLMLANQLVRRGVDVLIIDRHSGPSQQTRAMVVHARTLEIYAQLGIAERAIALGRRGEGANIWSQGQWKARLPVGDIGQGVSPYPYVLMLGQDDNERILGEQLERAGPTVRWCTELIALDQRPSGVTATLKQPDGSLRKVTAAYVAGCDGARSAVRELNGIGFPGAPYEHVFFVADTEATGPVVHDEVNVFLWREGFHLFFPMRGKDRWRVIGILPEHLRDKLDPTFADVTPEISRDASAEVRFTSCGWFSTYRIHHRCAERFQNGRCFVLGDAAHVHSPMGGQGMNTGLQDAYNLAWKLALVIHGRAEPELLDSYEVERIAVARRLLATTDRAFRLVVSDTWLAGIFRTRIFARIAAVAFRRKFAQRLAFATLSQTGIAYRQSPLARTLAGIPSDAPRAGDRFPWLQLVFREDGPIEDLFQKLDDTRFNLLVLGQPAPALAAETRDWLRVYSIPNVAHNAEELARARVPMPSFYLLRPDGHVGLAGRQLGPDALATYLADVRVRAGSRLPKGGAVAYCDAASASALDV